MGFDPGKNKPESVAGTKVQSQTGHEKKGYFVIIFFSSVPVRYLVRLFPCTRKDVCFVDAVNMGLAIEHSVNRHIKIRIWLIN